MVRTTPNRLIWIGALLISSFAPDRRKLAGKYAHKPSLQRTRFLAVIAACAALAAPLCRAQALYSPGASAIALDQLADSHSPKLLEAIERAFPEKAVELGRVWIGERHDFFFAVRVSSKPMLLIDDVPGPEMQNVRGTNLWYALAHIERLGALHSFYYKVDGEKFGGSLNMPAFGDLSYPMPGVKAGTLSAKQTIVSKIFPGMKSDYWIYVPAGYDPHVPAALMVFQDGGLALSRDSGIRLLAVVDNLVAQRMVPYMICIFVNPGTTEGSENPDAMRSMLYDTVSDRYPRFLRDELLAEVSTQYSIRKDGYSHAIVGFSSGGNGSFNAAWQLPETFSRLVSGIGSYTSLQWKKSPDITEGGQDYPDKVLHERHHNLRVWLQDGSDDLELAQNGSWPLGNVRMANALKLEGYDFHFSFGKGGHGPEQVEAEFPEVMRWLWRDYDASKSEQTFEMEPAEKAKPVFRIAIFNRDSD
jgi:enterochelin esterase-like enzyme